MNIGTIKLETKITVQRACNHDESVGKVKKETSLKTEKEPNHAIKDDFSDGGGWLEYQRIMACT